MFAKKKKFTHEECEWISDEDEYLCETLNLAPVHDLEKGKKYLSYTFKEVLVELTRRVEALEKK